MDNLNKIKTSFSVVWLKIKKFVFVILGLGIVYAAGVELLPEKLVVNGKTYEFLVRVTDKLTSKTGDCITFKDAGWDWGTNERKHFAILKVDNITYEQSQEWCSFGTATTTVYTTEGNPKEYQAKKYNFDVNSMPQKVDWVNQEKAVLPVTFYTSNIQLKK